MSEVQLLFVECCDETPIHRERDRPKKVSIRGWNAFLDTVCLRGGVRFTHESLLRVLGRCRPEFRGVTEINKLTSVHLAALEYELTLAPWIGEAGKEVPRE